MKISGKCTVCQSLLKVIASVTTGPTAVPNLTKEGPISSCVQSGGVMLMETRGCGWDFLPPAPSWRKAERGQGMNPGSEHSRTTPP